MKDRPLYPGYRRREAQRANRSGLQAMQLGDYERAEMLFRYAATLMPDSWGVWVNLGNSVGNRQRYRESLRHYHHAHTIAPLEHAPRVNAGYAHLALGEYREGWALYEERWRDPGFHGRTGIVADGNKRWDGVPREGKTLLVFSEQGSGDVIQMLRYWGALTVTGMDVIYRVPASLFRLVRRNVPPNAQVVMSTERVPQHDYHVPFMSLPLMFRTFSDSQIPAADGYLGADANREVAAWGGCLVGLVWAGNPAHPSDARRSVPVDALIPLRDTKGVSWVSLQFGDQEAPAEWPMYRHPCRDFSETAQLIRALDCVVACDTATAHVAGALGVPVLLMLAKENDWRWGVSGDRTPWYSSVRLIRQSHSGDWSTVVSRVRYLLDQMAHQRRVA